MVKLKPRKQKAAGDGGASGSTSNFLHERLVRDRLAARACHTSLPLDRPKHFFPLDPVIRMAHDGQHLEGCQGVECPVILTKVEARHRWLG